MHSQEQAPIRQLKGDGRDYLLGVRHYGRPVARPETSARRKRVKEDERHYRHPASGALPDVPRQCHNLHTNLHELNTRSKRWLVDDVFSRCFIFTMHEVTNVRPFPICFLL